MSVSKIHFIFQYSNARAYWPTDNPRVVPTFTMPATLLNWHSSPIDSHIAMCTIGVLLARTFQKVQKCSADSIGCVTCARENMPSTLGFVYTDFPHDVPFFSLSRYEYLYRKALSLIMRHNMHTPAVVDLDCSRRRLRVGIPTRALLFH